MMIRRLLSEPLARAAAAAVVLLVLSSLSIGIFRGLDPSVEPMAPPDALLAVTEQAIQQGPAIPASADFVARPLFESSRRPKVALEVAPAEEAQDVQEVTALEGVRLVGVFSSASTSGAILLSEEEGRKRILVGQTYEGWTLETVEGRGVVFVGGGGRQARLDMETITEVVLPVVSAQAAENNSDDAPADDGPLTFESMYRKMKEKQEQADDPQT